MPQRCDYRAEPALCIAEYFAAVQSTRFLLSAQARYITGQTLVVDGGATLVGPSRTPGS
jgi:NAD(P)-dependent dehydrogenase (short-subunit alcohol dehydrogenase family)